MITEQKKLLTIHELAELLAVTRSWVRSQIFKRTIPFIKVGALIRFDFHEIQKWIEDKKIKEESWN